MEFVKTHKKLCITLAAILVIFILFILLIRLLSPDLSKNLYGNRLSGIDSARITEDRMKSMNIELSEQPGIESITYDLHGRLVNLVVMVKPDTSKEQAKEYANKTLEYFKDNEKKYYDIQIFLMNNEKSTDENSIYPMIGYKHKTGENFIWKRE